MEKVKKIKIYIGLFYLTIVGIFLYYLFSKFSLEQLSSYEFIKDNVEHLSKIKTKNILPKPIFKRRLESVISTDPLELRFLNKSIKFSTSIDWHKKELKEGTRLWLLNLHLLV